MQTKRNCLLHIASCPRIYFLIQNSPPFLRDWHNSGPIESKCVCKRPMALRTGSLNAHKEALRESGEKYQSGDMTRWYLSLGDSSNSSAKRQKHQLCFSCWQPWNNLLWRLQPLLILPTALPCGTTEIWMMICLQICWVVIVFHTN